MRIIGCFLLRSLPFIYSLFIWWQSSEFNPESVSSLSYLLGGTTVAMIGIGLELAHLFEFGLLFLFIILAFLSLGHQLNKENKFVAFYISILYGLIDEIHQGFVPFRSTSLIDLLKDIIGVVAVWYLVHYFQNKSDSKIGSLLRKISVVARKNHKDISM